MHILVTGATGRVGSRLVPRLLQKGHSVRLLIRDAGRAQSLAEQGAMLREGDLLNPQTLRKAVDGSQAVIHLAAFFRGATPEQTEAVNLQGTAALAEAALQAGVSRFIFASTNLVYGPGKADTFREEDAVRATAPYPLTKAKAEQALLEMHRSQGLGLRIVRLAFVYGEDDPHLSEGLQWFRNWHPAQRIHLLHHADAAQALILAAVTPGIDGEIYNAADDEPVSAGQIMGYFNEAVAKDAADRSIDFAWQQIVDTTKIREHLGFAPLFPSLQDAIAARTM